MAAGVALKGRLDSEGLGETEEAQLYQEKDHSHLC